MAEEVQYASDSGTNKRKYEDNQNTPSRRPTGFSAPISSQSPPDSSGAGQQPPSYNSVPPPMDEIQLAKQKAQEIAARLFNNASEATKRPRVENGAGGGFDITESRNFNSFTFTPCFEFVFFLDYSFCTVLLLLVIFFFLLVIRIHIFLILFGVLSLYFGAGILEFYQFMSVHEHVSLLNDYQIQIYGGVPLHLVHIPSSECLSLYCHGDFVSAVIHSGYFKIFLMILTCFQNVGLQLGVGLAPKPLSSNIPPSMPSSYGSYPGPSKKIEIPNGRVGVIIGKGGETIKYLQLQSGAKIQVTRDMDADPNSATRAVELMGTPEQISKAEQLINDVLSEVPIFFFHIFRAFIPFQW